MREIKFKLWLPEIQKMTYALSIYDWANGYEEITVGEKATWLQFTGLKDKNGKEIYEGDICQIHYYHDKTIPSPIGIVDWIDSGFSIRAVKNIDNTAMTGIYSLRFKSGGHFGDSPAVEVIGNIYSNPELLKP